MVNRKLRQQIHTCWYNLSLKVGLVSMKTALIRSGAYAMVASLIMAGVAHRSEEQAKDQAQTQCNVESKDQYYSAFQAANEGDVKDQVKALEAAKKYLACPVDSKDKSEVLAKLNVAVGRILSSRDSSSDAIP